MSNEKYQELYTKIFWIFTTFMLFLKHLIEVFYLKLHHFHP